MNKHQTHDQLVLHISGIGPTGLAAAITCARAGAKVVVHERQQAAGMRFDDDFQGQENWTSSIDVLEELTESGIRTDFPHTAFYHLVPEGYAYLLIHQNCTCSWCRCSKGASYA